MHASRRECVTVVSAKVNCVVFLEKVFHALLTPFLASQTFFPFCASFLGTSPSSLRRSACARCNACPHVWRSWPPYSGGTAPSPSSLLRFGFPQMNPCDLTDSLATITHQPNECPHCHSALGVSSGLCLRCLLQAGLTEEEDSGSESLDALLCEIE